MEKEDKVEGTEGVESTPSDIPPNMGGSEGVDPTPSTLPDSLSTVFNRVVLSDLANAKNIFICGKRNYGKTYDTNILANMFHQSKFRIHVVSPITGKISGCLHSPLNSPVSPKTNESMELETAYLHCLMDAREGIPTVLIIDEVDTYCTSHKMMDALKTVYNLGRHMKIWLVANARIPSRVHRDITTLYDIVICHYITGQRNFDYITDITDEEFSRKCQEQAERIQQIIATNETDNRKYERQIYIG